MRLSHHSKKQPWGEEKSLQSSETGLYLYSCWSEAAWPLSFWYRRSLALPRTKLRTPEWCCHVWRNPGAAHHLPDTILYSEAKRWQHHPVGVCFSDWDRDTRPGWGRAERSKWQHNPVIHPPTKQLPSAHSQDRGVLHLCDRSWLVPSDMTGGTSKWLPSNCPHPAWQDLQSSMAEFIKIQICTRHKTKQSVNYNISCSCILWWKCTQWHSFAYSAVHYLIKICKYLTKYPNSGCMQPMFRMFSGVKKKIKCLDAKEIVLQIKKGNKV